MRFIGGDFTVYYRLIVPLRVVFMRSNCVLMPLYLLNMFTILPHYYLFRRERSV